MKIDMKKTYRTREGNKVELIRINLEPVSAEQGPATFCVKGTIISKYPSGRTKREYNIWRLDGRYSIFKETPDDLIEVK